MTLTQQLAQFIASGIVNGTIYALLGLGLVAIHSVTRVVNVAQGEFAALGALLASTLVAGEMPLPLAAGVAVARAPPHLPRAAAIRRWWPPRSKARSSASRPARRFRT